MIAALCVIFLLSGAAALVFETLWFRQAGLALGHTVWASALVTASFMAGLAIGNAAVARLGRRASRPLAAYAALELLVGVTGIGLVLLFPLVGKALAPLMGSLGGAALNAMALGLVLATAWYALRKTRSVMLARGGRCVACGYPVQALDRCPECGAVSKRVTGHSSTLSPRPTR